MPVENDVLTNVPPADLPTVLDDLDFEGYELVERVPQANGLLTLHVRKNSATGVPQSPTEADAIVPPH